MDFLRLFVWFFILPYYALFDRDDSGCGIGAAFGKYLVYYAAGVSIMVQIVIVLFFIGFLLFL